MTGFHDCPKMKGSLKRSSLTWFGLIILLLTRSATVNCSRELMADSADAQHHREQILDMHNYLRSEEAGRGFDGGAVFMNRLTYDLQAEAYARNYAHQLCSSGQWKHSSRSAPMRTSRGENLYTNSVDYSGQHPQHFDSAVVVKKWWDERQDFNWHSNNPYNEAMSRGKIVGHWTQVVRAEASVIGCWIITGCQCSSNAPCAKEQGHWSTYVVCHYDAGNSSQFPYWPLARNLQFHIPSYVPRERRQRCGNCPRGFTVCGTRQRAEVGMKQDAHLCEGMWNINSSLPSPYLLQQSIAKKNQPHSADSWHFMVRTCKFSNGGCPYNSRCLEESDRNTRTEPRVLQQQCRCDGFSTSRGTFFERDFCGIYPAYQPSNPTDRFLSFITDDTVKETEYSGNNSESLLQMLQPLSEDETAAADLLKTEKSDGSSIVSGEIMFEYRRSTSAPDDLTDEADEPSMFAVTGNKLRGIKAHNNLKTNIPAVNHLALHGSTHSMLHKAEQKEQTDEEAGGTVGPFLENLTENDENYHADRRRPSKNKLEPEENMQEADPIKSDSEHREETPLESNETAEE